MIITVTLEPSFIDNQIFEAGKSPETVIKFRGDFLAVVDKDGVLNIVEAASGSDFYDEDVLFCFAAGSWRHFSTDRLSKDDSGYLRLV